MECLRLRVKDVDLTSNQIVVRAGKGDKDQHAMLPTAVKEPLAKHLDLVKRQHQRDLERGLGRVALPNALGRKYPNGIRLQPICLRMDMTSAPFRNSSATAMSARR